MDVSNLRPVERRVVAMRDAGLGVEEIASRLRRSAAHVERMMSWIEIPRSRPPVGRSVAALERRVLALRAEGETHDQIGARFRRSGDFIRRVEGLAHYRKALELLAR